MDVLLGAAASEALFDVDHESSPTDEIAFDELPRIKIDPPVVLGVSVGVTPAAMQRQLLAQAAERRRAAAEGHDARQPTSRSMAGADKEAGAEAGADVEDGALMLCATGSTFGTLIAELPDGVSGELAMADPYDASSELTNASELQGKMVIMARGGCSFVEKVRRAQEAGAAAAIVVQTGTTWPFSMSDSKAQGGDITLPSLMLSPADGGKLCEVVKQAVGSAAQLQMRAWGAARAQNSQSSCAVCLQEMIASTMAVRLPCSHTFHEDCIHGWLRKKHTCPTCRAELPTRDQREQSGRERQPRARTWSDYDLPRGGRPPPSSSMYT